MKNIKERTIAQNIIKSCLGFAPKKEDIKLVESSDTRLEFIIGTKGYCVCKMIGMPTEYTVYMYNEVTEDMNFKNGIDIGGVERIK